MAYHILIVEDEEKIARVIELELDHEGYVAEKAKTGKEALKKYDGGHWDLILLDVMIPQLNGMEVLRRIRAVDQTTPVILLTARDSVVDKVTGLDQGADDYVTKPFEIEELLARIRVCLRLRRSAEEPPDRDHETIRIGDLTASEKQRIVRRSDREIDLTPREFDLLLFLMTHHRQVLSRDQILQNVWGFEYFGDTNVVDVYIRYLRKKIDDPFDVALIHTVRGVGYVLRCEKN